MRVRVPALKAVGICGEVYWSGLCLRRLTAMSDAPVHIKARYVLLWAIPALAIGTLVLPVPAWFGVAGTPTGPLATAMLVYGMEGSWFALTAVHAHIAGLRVADLFRTAGINAWRLALIGLPMIGSALFCIYVLFAPLSLVFPEGVQSWLFEDQPVLYLPGPLLPNVASFIAVSLVAPIAEEWLFRGLLLRRWAAKVGPVRAVFRSSLLFSLMHADVLGGFIFSVTMAGLFARYRTLWAPIIVHMANNALVCVASVLFAHTGLDEPGTVAELRGQWWVAVAGAAVTLPWLFRLRKVWVPIAQWQFEPASRAAPAESSEKLVPLPLPARRS